MSQEHELSRSSDDDDDEDYVPQGKDCESVSEVESEGDVESAPEDENDENKVIINKGKSKKPTKREKSKQSRKRKKLSIEKDGPEGTEVDEAPETKILTEEEEKKKADLLWADFTKDAGETRVSSFDFLCRCVPLDKSKKFCLLTFELRSLQENVFLIFNCICVDLIFRFFFFTFSFLQNFVNDDVCILSTWQVIIFHSLSFLVHFTGLEFIFWQRNKKLFNFTMNFSDWRILAFAGSVPKAAATASAAAAKPPKGCRSISPVVRPKIEEKVKITKIFEFAGEEVKVEKEVSVDSAEARLSLASVEKPAANKSESSIKGLAGGRGGKRTGLGGLSSVLGQLGKKAKISTLEKSKLDWDTFKKEEKIDEEINTHNRGKDGYLERQDFLQRADVRRFEIEKQLRLSRRSSRWNSSFDQSILCVKKQ